MARLYLVSPRSIDPQTFPVELDAALSAGDVASFLIAPEGISDAARQRIAEILVPIAQRHGVAAVVEGDSRAAGRSHADGVQVGSIEAVAEASRTFHPDGIVGVGGLRSRHEAMEAGESGCDYVFFGNLQPPETPEVHARNLDLAAWWAPLFECPCVVLAGSEIGSVADALATGAEFVALRDAVWNHPEGPAVAIKAANRLIADHREPA